MCLLFSDSNLWTKIVHITTDGACCLWWKCPFDRFWSINLICLIIRVEWSSSKVMSYIRLRNIRGKAVSRWKVRIWMLIKAKIGQRQWRSVEPASSLKGIWIRFVWRISNIPGCSQRPGCRRIEEAVLLAVYANSSWGPATGLSLASSCISGDRSGSQVSWRLDR